MSTTHDADGHPICIGDKVLVLQVPLSIRTLPADAKQAFSRAIGHVIRVDGIVDDGSLELDVSAPRFEGMHTVWLEPDCVRRIGRGFSKPLIRRSRYYRSGDIVPLPSFQRRRAYRKTVF